MDKIIKKYSDLHVKHQKIGWYYKSALLLTTVPLGYFAFYYFQFRLGGRNAKEFHSDFNILIITFIFTSVYFLVILSIKSKSFVNTYSVNRTNRLYKIEIFEAVKRKVPELKFYNSIQKIQPKYFNHSNLFQKNVEDYEGNDFMSGKYKDVKFELSELHVFTLLKNVFHGVFVVCFFDFELVNTEKTVLLIESSDEFSIIDGEINLSANKNYFYIAISQKEKLFENEQNKSISKLELDFLKLKAIINLTKKSIDLFKKMN